MYVPYYLGRNGTTIYVTLIYIGPERHSEPFWAYLYLVGPEQTYVLYLLDQLVSYRLSIMMQHDSHSKITKKHLKR